MSALPGDELHELAERQDPRLLRALDVVAPGGSLREGLDNIVHASTGGLIVVSDPGDISHLLSGGIKLDIDYTPAMLYQVAKMDGAIVLNPEATKIIWANVQLMPDPTILSTETGTRHRTAERVSKQTEALVIAISQRRDVVSLYVEGTKRTRAWRPWRSTGSGSKASRPASPFSSSRAAASSTTLSRSCSVPSWSPGWRSRWSATSSSWAPRAG
jgi:hypothetical protein